MSLDTTKLLALPAEEKLRLVETLWDNLGESTAPIPLPDWAIQEGLRRREEMTAKPSLGLSHVEVWKRIDARKGCRE